MSNFNKHHLKQNSSINKEQASIASNMDAASSQAANMHGGYHHSNNEGAAAMTDANADGNHDHNGSSYSVASIPLNPATNTTATAVQSSEGGRITKQFEKNVKILLLGDSGVGKTCMMMKFTESTFDSNFITTIGIDYKYKVVNIEGKPIRLEIWDSAGQERFRSITSSYLRGAHGILLCYDISDVNSFYHIEDWLNQIAEYSDVNVNKLLVGNKCDKELQRHVTTQDGETLAQSHGMQFIEVSAMTGKNIDKCFTTITKMVLDRMKGIPSNNGMRSQNHFQLSSNEPKVKMPDLSCCNT